MDFLEVFCEVDDFCQNFSPIWNKRLIQGAEQHRNRRGELNLSELMTIMIQFHNSGFRTFKYYYLHLQKYHRKDFPNLVSYNRFVELMPSIVVPLGCYLSANRGESTGIYFVDSTKIAVCKSKRIGRNRVFKGLAQTGKTGEGWFYGLKLHLVINEIGEIVSFSVTPGNVNDRSPLPTMVKGLAGKLFGDKGYIGKKLFELLLLKNLQLVTKLKENMKNKLMPMLDKLLLRKRCIIETVNDLLKNVYQVEHSRHRSPTNFLVNLLAALAAYSFRPKKPAINFGVNADSNLPKLAQA